MVSFDKPEITLNSTIRNKTGSIDLLTLPTVHIGSINAQNLFLEAKSTIDSAITDPNFNQMRNNDTGKFKAIFLVGGLIILAVVVPLGTWWALSR